MNLSPVALSLTLVLGVLLLALPRRLALLPILCGVIFIPADQRIIIATLDFSMIRILVLFAAARVIVRGELRPLKLNAIDFCVFALPFIYIVTATLLYGTVGAFVNRLGIAFDLIGVYTFTRLLLRGWEDLRTTIYVATYCLGVFAVFMTIEWTTGRNLFSAIGGVPEITWIRDGRLRCQGAIAHPILAGVFGAVWTPLAFSLWWRRERVRAVLGYLAGFFIVVFSASSTPLLALVMGAGALMMWPLRKQMRAVRWASLAVIIFLHLVREKPVWHLLARINVVGGSTGYHRYKVIDKAIEHFDEWWLLGTPVIDHWRITSNDITNQYVGAGINGGLWAMLMYIAIISFSFQLIGRSVNSPYLTPDQRRFAWALGATHFTHAAIFFAVAYFGQVTYIWYLHIAFAAAMAEITVRQTRHVQRVRAREARESPPQPSPDPAPVAPGTLGIARRGSLS